MALTQAQEVSRVFKALMGVAETNISKQFFEEPLQSSIIVQPSMIWSDAGLIPSSAPSITPVSQVDPETNLTLTYGDSGVVRYYLWVPLLPVAGSPNAFYHPCLHNTIPFNFDVDGTYSYRLRNSSNSDIAFGNQDWLVDPVAGTLTFYGSSMFSLGISAVEPPLLTYYRYIGRLGFTQTNATTFSSEFAVTSPTDFSWSARGTGIDDISSIVGAVNANAEDLAQYVSLVRTRGAALGVAAGANLIGTKGLSDVTPTSGTLGGDANLQAMLEGIKAYVDSSLAVIDGGEY